MKAVKETSGSVFDQLTKFRSILQLNPGNAVIEKTVANLEKKFNALHEVAMKGIFDKYEVDVDFAEWLQWAYAQYKIVQEDFGVQVVISHCTVEPGRWEYESVEECKLKIEQLIGYKIRDRKLGHGNMAKDLGLVA